MDYACRSCQWHALEWICVAMNKKFS
jgi:hypothetical protein